MMATKKMGRPTENPRNKTLRLRLAQNELDKIQRCADLLNENRTNALVKSVDFMLEYLERRQISQIAQGFPCMKYFNIYRKPIQIERSNSSEYSMYSRAAIRG